MNPKIKHSRDRAFKRFVYIFFFLMCACFVLPLIVVISASFTSEQALTSGGFSLLPRDFTLDAYKSAFSSGTRVLRAYGVTNFSGCGRHGSQQPRRSTGSLSAFQKQLPLPQAHHGLYLLHHALQRRYDSELHYLRQVL